MDNTVDVDFVPADIACACLGKTNEELLLQWGLQNTLTVDTFKILGSCPTGTALNVHSFAKCMLANTAVLRALQIKDTPPAQAEVSSSPLLNSVRSMAFFDKLTDAGVVSPTGALRGCFEEIYHGFTVGDKLREMFVNEDSEHASLFDPAEQSELIYRLFKIFCVGGAMCQADNDIGRYLSMTQALYKELVTIYKASSNNEVRVSTRCVQVHSVEGLDLFAGSDNPMNSFYLVIDPLKKQVHVVRYVVKSVW